MDPAHERVTRIGLEALGGRGFALAGGYAVNAHGIGSRLSEDVDLFTDRADDDFAEAVGRLRAAYEANGYRVEDAVGSKVGAMYGRAEARDFLDVHAALTSGRFSREQLLELGDRREASPMDRQILAQQLSMASQITDRAYERYGATAAEIDSVRRTMTDWAAGLRVRQADPGAATPLHPAQDGVASPGRAVGGVGRGGDEVRSDRPYGRDRGPEGPEL